MIKLRVKLSLYMPRQAAESSRWLRHSRFLENRHVKVTSFSALRTGHLYPSQRRFLVLISVGKLSRPQAHSAAGRIKSMKNLKYPIETATSRLVAQCFRVFQRLDDGGNKSSESVLCVCQYHMPDISRQRYALYTVTKILISSAPQGLQCVVLGQRKGCL
jgi:hypothetical protein